VSLVGGKVKNESGLLGFGLKACRKLEALEVDRRLHEIEFMYTRTNDTLETFSSRTCSRFWVLSIRLSFRLSFRLEVHRGILRSQKIF
jgi:hypothetical protein